MEWEIRNFDPATASRELWARMHAYSNHRHRENEYPGEPPPDQVREDFFRGMPWTVLYVESGEEFAGVAYLRDGPGGESVHLGGGVRVPYRRRGIGTVWLRAARARMETGGCAKLEAKSAGADGKEFFRHVGFTRVSSEGGSRLDLPRIDAERMARWEDDLVRRAPGVRLEIHANDLSDDALSDYMSIRDRFPDVGETRDTVGEWRQLIERLRGADGVNHTIFAREADGAITGMTEAIWRPDRADHVTQEFTGVVPEARGRGLGKALKAAMLRFVTERHPEVTEIGTTNDTANDPMLSINERMGFRRTIEVVHFAIGRDELDRWLATRER